MVAMLDAHCLPHVADGAVIAPDDMSPTSAGVTDSLLDGQAGRAWSGANPALALYDYDEADSCGVFGLGVDATEFGFAAETFAREAGFAEGPVEAGRLIYLRAAGDDEVILLIATAVPDQGVAALNAIRLPAADVPFTIPGEN